MELIKQWCTVAMLLEHGHIVRASSAAAIQSEFNLNAFRTGALMRVTGRLLLEAARDLANLPGDRVAIAHDIIKSLMKMTA